MPNETSVRNRIYREYMHLLEHPVVESTDLIRLDVDDDHGYLRVRASLINGDFLEVTMYVSQQQDIQKIEDYRYQWMNGNRTQLRRRWDNAPHFPRLPDFPHHCHVGSEDNVEPSNVFTVAELLDRIESELHR
jgi:hypothetical protein